MHFSYPNWVVRMDGWGAPCTLSVEASIRVVTPYILSSHVGRALCLHVELELLVLV